MWAERKTLCEIVKEVGPDMATVKRWLGESCLKD
jgi:hypothetical protein